MQIARDPCNSRLPSVCITCVRNRSQQLRRGHPHSMASLPKATRQMQLFLCLHAMHRHNHNSPFQKTQCSSVLGRTIVTSNLVYQPCQPLAIQVYPFQVRCSTSRQALHFKTAPIMMTVSQLASPLTATAGAARPPARSPFGARCPPRRCFRPTVSGVRAERGPQQQEAVHVGLGASVLRSPFS